jgi:DNA-directed RNA polymerase specialized sigma subunit, sigma24 homolog
LEAFVTGLRIEDDSGAFAAQVATDRHAMLVENVANQRDRNAFQELFSFFAPRLKSFALRLGCDAALAEEIAQDVMVTVWSKAHLYDRLQSSVSTWVFRIARQPSHRSFAPRGASDLGYQRSRLYRTGEPRS